MDSPALWLHASSTYAIVAMFSSDDYIIMIIVVVELTMKCALEEENVTVFVSAHKLVWKGR